MKKENNQGISFFQRYLTVWVFLCIPVLLHGFQGIYRAGTGNRISCRRRPFGCRALYRNGVRLECADKRKSGLYRGPGGYE